MSEEPAVVMVRGQTLREMSLRDLLSLASQLESELPDTGELTEADEAILTELSAVEEELDRRQP